MSNSVIIVAGGLGSRMGSEIPKQFLLLKGKPVIFHTIQQFVDYDPEIKITVVLPDEHLSTWQTMCTKNIFHVEHSVVLGGETRFHSVKNGLDSVNNADLIAIHDSVRPHITKTFIEHCFNEAQEKGTAIPCLKINESLRELMGNESKILDRERIRIVQTPQVFKSSVIKEAYEQTYRNSFTDDASVVESTGYRLNIVEGLRGNIKITHPEDLLFSEWMLNNSTF